jgi:hypothetical protein
MHVTDEIYVVAAVLYASTSEHLDIITTLKIHQHP